MSNPHSAKKKVLVVDDQPEITTIIRSRVEHAGYEVAVANCGREALRRVNDFRPDLVVLDVIMDDLTGYEVCAQLKTDHPNLPVIMLTSQIKTIHENLAYACKADAFIRKPHCGEYLVPEIQKQLNKAASAVAE